MLRVWLGLLILLPACGPGLPAPECDAGTAPDEPALSCEVAVDAALGVVAPGHTAIQRIQFLYGSATPCCSYLVPEGEEAPVQGYVVFTYGDGSPREYVALTLWRGELEVAEPAAY